MHFAHPSVLWLFVVFVPLIIWYIYKQGDAQPALQVSSVAPFDRMPRSFKEYLRHLLFALRMLTLGCFIIILARPQTSDSWSESTVNGTDIVIALDVSPSMQLQDLQPDRLEAAKDVAKKFVAGRENDNLGLVLFSSEAMTAMPMTTDRAALSNYISTISHYMLGESTSLGDGLATAINRIKDGKAVSQSIILVTDGSNNDGQVSPMLAAEIAAEYGIKVYTIGIGTNGEQTGYTTDRFGRRQPVVYRSEFDEPTLRSIAETTGGKYFNARDNEALEQIFAEIDSLEKSRIDVRNFSHTEDQYEPWALLALILLLAELCLRHTVLRSIP